MHSTRKRIFIIVTVVLFFLIPSSALAQISPNYVVGTGVVPSIDGVWHTEIWNEAVELPVAYSNITSIQPAYVRLMHDESWLYFIYDVPFDTTKPSTSTSELPFIVLVFDGKAMGFNATDPNDAEIVSEVTSTGQTAVNYVGSNYPNYHPYLGQVINQVTIVQTLGSSPHSSVPHRIWEGKLPLEPIIKNSPKDPDDQSPIIGFNTEVQDALGNWEQLQPLSKTYSIALLEIAPYPVPENLNLITPLLLTISILAAYGIKRNRNRALRNI